MLTAITRAVSPALNDCELEHLERQEIDIAKASEQHREYEECLRSLGASVLSLPAEPDLPDSMFVEDPAVVVNEVAVMTRMGALSRRPESESLALALARFRPLRWLREPATLEGGDVLRLGSAVFAGLSSRSNAEGVAQLAAELSPFGYSVRGVAVRGCLHLKSACCAIGERTILANRAWFDAARIRGIRNCRRAARRTPGRQRTDCRRDRDRPGVLSRDRTDAGAARLEGADTGYFGADESRGRTDLLQHPAGDGLKFLHSKCQ